MIPLRDQDSIRQRFARDLAGRVRIDFFTQRPTPIIVPGREECAYCEQVGAILREVASLDERITLTVHELMTSRDEAAKLGVNRPPGIVIRGQANRSIRYFGTPGGKQFVPFIDAIVAASGEPVTLLPETERTLRRLKTDLHLQVFETPDCEHSPAYVKTAVKLALQNASIHLSIVEAAEFPALVERYGIRAVPTTVINHEIALPGAMNEATLMTVLMSVASGKEPKEALQAGAATVFDLNAAEEPSLRPVGSSGLVVPR